MIAGRFIAGGLVSLLLACGAQARSFEALVTHISDGDTLWVRERQGERALPVRLRHIDAPEICQQHGRQSRDALAALTLRRQVRVEVATTDAYERLVASVHVDGQDVAATLVAAGQAWSPRFRGRRGPYDSLQASARDQRLGLWADPQPRMPREFRRQVPSCWPPTQ